MKRIPLILLTILPMAQLSAQAYKMFGNFRNEVVLNINETLHSRNGQYNLTLQPDGNLVLHRGKLVKWASNTGGSMSTLLVMQSDGNLVLYNNTAATWASNTGGNSNAQFSPQEDGNLVIYSSNGTPIWSSNTASADYKSYVNHERNTGKGALIVQPRFSTKNTVLASYIATDYTGIDKTGVSNSTNAIKNILRECQANGGGTVWFPAGQYLITEKIDVPEHCYIRGDWNDPEAPTFSPNQGYGTVMLMKNQATIHLSNNAGIDGLTFFYPDQNASLSSVIPYPTTVNISGYFASVRNTTFINAYNGIHIDRSIHESATLKNIRATFLNLGFEAYNGSDVSIWENIHVKPDYWANARINNAPTPALNTLRSLLYNRATAFQMGDVEWDQFIDIHVAYCNWAFKTVRGQRIQFIGEIADATFTHCKNGIDIADADPFWTYALTVNNATIQSDNTTATASTPNPIILNHTTVNTNPRLSNTILTKSPLAQPVPFSSVPDEPTHLKTRIFNAGSAGNLLPKVSGNQDGSIPYKDVSEELQQLLNTAGSSGGGIVYLPSGLYLVNRPIIIPANVELRGVASAPNRNIQGTLNGTCIFTEYGHDTKEIVYSQQALFSTVGNSAGISGLRIFYPSNPKLDFNYPFAVRLAGEHNYATNISLENAVYGIDAIGDHHYVERIHGTAKMMFIRAYKGGVIKNVISNGNSVVRNNYHIHDWPNESNDLFRDIINPKTRKNEIGILIEDIGYSANEYIVNAFCYGCLHFIYNNAHNTAAFNIGADNLGVGGYAVVATQNITVANSMRFAGNGTALGLNGAGITLYNDNEKVVGGRNSWSGDTPYTHLSGMENNQGVSISLSQNVLNIASQRTIKHVKVYNIYGKVFYDQAINGDYKKHQIPSSSFESGVYIVKTTGDHGNTNTQKVLLERRN